MRAATLDNDALIAEKYAGIRPAPGYLACPDHLVKRDMFDVLRADEIGMSVTDSLAMLPAASVSGFYLAHPDSTYFGRQIGQDQLRGLRGAWRCRSTTRAARDRLAGDAAGRERVGLLSRPSGQHVFLGRQNRQDQLEDYAQRMALSLDDARRALAPQL